MPSEITPMSAVNNESRRLNLRAVAGFLALGLIGVGIWYWYTQSLISETHAEFINKVSTNHPLFAEAERLAIQSRYTEAIPLYQAVLREAANDDQRVLFKLQLARSMVRNGEYQDALSLLKEIVAMEGEPRFARARATAVEEVSGIYARGNAETNSQIFKEEPFKSLQADRVDVTLRQFHEFAASIDPIAIANLWIAQWYAYQLPDVGRESKLTEEALYDLKQQIAKHLSAADRDIDFMRQQGTFGADLRYALVMRAIVSGLLSRKGELSYGDPHELFREAIEAYAAVGDGFDCIPRYYYALFMAQSEGVARTEDIKKILEPLSGDVYVQSKQCSFLEKSRMSNYNRQFVRLLGNIDGGFKNTLRTLGWTEADFSL